jgi:hypothetical protein
MVLESPAMTHPTREAGAGVPATDRRRLPFWVDPEPLLAALEGLPSESWTDHFAQQNYEGVWRILPLRGPAGETHPIRLATAHPGDRDFEDTQALLSMPDFQALLPRFQCELRSVRVMALGPGSSIREHRDPDLDGGDGPVRLHICLATHDGVSFRLNGQPVPFRAGEGWYLRLSDPHAVENPGPGPRVHLVLDAVRNPWLDGILALPDEAAKALAFMDRLGLRWELAALGEETFLPGLALEEGVLKVDPSHLKHPGDILHEAGHMALTPGGERGALGPEGLQDPGFEIATLAWSYAAALHLGIPPEVVFHSGGYKGQSAWILGTLQSGGLMGQPLLAWLGLTSCGNIGDGKVQFPAMSKWLRD